MRLEPTFSVERHTVAAVLVLVDIVEVDAEQRIRQPPRQGEVTQVEVDDEGCQSSEQWVPAYGELVPVERALTMILTPFPAANVGILRPDDTIPIWIPVFAMLLEDRTILAFRSVAILCCAIWMFSRGCYGGARSTSVLKDIVFRRLERFSQLGNRLLRDRRGERLLVDFEVAGGGLRDATVLAVHDSRAAVTRHFQGAME